MTLLALLCSVLLLLGLPAQAQTQDPWGSWRTVQTEHYRLHYPIEAEPWALLAAGQLDEIRARVVEEVGWAPEQTVDIVVMDPFRQSNGFAIPLVASPRMGLFATPPDATPYFGYYRSWAEELLVHEDAHLVHLLRPSRNPALRALGQGLLGFTPMSTRSPAWVIEGYATVVEGRLTGMGRPNADFRATLLRRWGQEGQLPTYGQLDGSQRWMGGSVRYLVGSAFLEWLELRAGPGSLRSLWARMTARKSRPFDEAFEGIFGGTPPELYARFCAEVTHAAMTLEDTRPVDAGTLWLDARWTTGQPTVSPDGATLAVVLNARKRPGHLTLLPTADDPEAEQEWQEAVDEVLAKDPQDVAPVRPEVFPREATHRRARTTHVPAFPRWTPDGSELLFVSWLRDGDGWYRPDVFAWAPETGRERRITHGADIVALDPHPDGTWAVGVRTFWGAQQLVRIDLKSGEWTPITEADPSVVLDAPRFHPKGDRFLYLRQQGTWHLVVRDVETGAEAEIPLPADAMVSAPTWSADGREILASLGQDGFFEIYALGLDAEPPRQLTASRGGAYAPAPTPDGTAIFYLSLDHEGVDVHRLALADALPPSEPAVVMAPVVRPPKPPPVSPPAVVAVSPERYGFGRQEPRVLLGGASTPHVSTLEAGLRLGDLVGRTDLLLLGSLSPGTPGIDGLSLAWAWRGLPVSLTLHGFAMHEDAAETLDRAGGALLLDSTRAWALGQIALRAGGWLDLPVAGDTNGTRTAGFLGAALRHRLVQGRAWAQPDLGARAQLGQTAGEGGWLQHQERVGLRLGFADLSLGAQASAGRTTATSMLDRFRLGGADTSLLPGPWSWSRVLVPSLAPGIARGEAFDALHADVGVSGISVFAERYRAGDACASIGVCDEGASSLAGLTAAMGTGTPVPLAKMPAVGVELGVACVFETPDAGMVQRACRQVSDWKSWVGVTYRP